VQRIKAVVALVLAFVWLPAASCCLIDASGLFAKQDCCSEERPRSASGPGDCDQPCGALASASYFPQQSQLLVFVPVGVPIFDGTGALKPVRPAVRVSRDFPATAPPELAGHWQFSFRTALLSRAPSFAS
jgi:hypothetical protein